MLPDHVRDAPALPAAASRVPERPVWRVVLRTAVATALFTTVFWFVMAVWWVNRTGGMATPDVSTAKAAAQVQAYVDQRQAMPTTAASAAGAVPKLIIPVAGVRPEQLVDTFADARANGARPHDAIDIMAPRGTPVVAASEGRVEKLFLSRDGGNTVYLRAPDGRWIYYYAHLDGYAPNLAEGLNLRPGDPIGTVGSTGNASPQAPHLHFAVWQTDPNRKWYEQAVAIDPYPLLRQSH